MSDPDVTDEIIEMAHQRLLEIVNAIPLLALGERFKTAKLDDFLDTDLQNDCRQALDGGRGVFIHGERGRGKTHLAAAVVREYLMRYGVACLDDSWQTREANGWQGAVTDVEIDRYIGAAVSTVLNMQAGVVFRNAVEIMDDIRAVFDGDGRRKSEVVDGYAETPLLVIDDIGMDKASEFVRETFDVIVNRRYTDMRLTMFTSNLTFDEIDKHYNDCGRLSSRVAGMCDIIELMGGDRRGR